MPPTNRKPRKLGCPKRWRRGEFIRNGTKGSKIYRCLDIDSARLLTVEQIPGQALDTFENAQLFVSKMNYLSQLSHPNLVRIVGGQLGIPKILKETSEENTKLELRLDQVVVNVFQRLPRGTILVDALAQGDLVPDVCLSIAQQLVHCVGYLHHNGVAHCNIHPSAITAAVNQSYLLSGLKGANFESEQSSDDWKVILQGDVWDLGCILLACYLGIDAYDNCMSFIGKCATADKTMLTTIRRTVESDLSSITSCANAIAFFRHCFARCWELPPASIQELLSSAWITTGHQATESGSQGEPVAPSPVPLNSATDQEDLSPPHQVSAKGPQGKPPPPTPVPLNSATDHGGTLPLVSVPGSREKLKAPPITPSKGAVDLSTAPNATPVVSKPARKRNLGLKLDITSDVSNEAGPEAVLIPDVASARSTNRPSSSHRRIDIESLLSKGGVVSFSNVKPGIVPAITTSPSGSVGLDDMFGGIRSSTPSSVRISSSGSLSQIKNSRPSGKLLDRVPSDKRTVAQQQFLQKLNRGEENNMLGSSRGQARMLNRSQAEDTSLKKIEKQHSSRLSVDVKVGGGIGHELATPSDGDHREQMNHKINGIMNWVQSFNADQATEENFQLALKASKK